ncbi:acyl-CoA/acyl-ACP dehydrogenase [Nocardioides sp. Y6]|uniref:Acyl-CoA/acyl-ACP dehydrogenase n=1 Tax=Nocardioides malaquae TaxID=2773426 RepID=A0ABR9RSW3_9ACTN|nr:acyl-CoA dehydrogenase family protein [Nocardioides malaquae]MBE7324651.1 acyl-CoA/acyl-ACP dehydrogenase [Nocardioides malaquae]
MSVRAEDSSPPRGAHQPTDPLTRVVAVAAAHARAVDREARFPHEAVESLRENDLLSAAHRMSVSEMVVVAERLARACGSTAMIWAMHQVQLACLVRHHPTLPLLDRALREQWLIASVTSEVGVGGNLRRSKAGVSDGGHHLSKRAPTVSYGEHAQAYLITARRDDETGGSDQVAVLAVREQVTLNRTGEWDVLGMRGTCSPPFQVEAQFDPDQVFPVPFAEIAGSTMVPLSHVLWSAVWIGLAQEAVSRALAMAKARSTADPVLARAHVLLAAAGAQLDSGLRAAQPVLEGEARSTFALALEMNALKVGVSETAVEVVGLALRSCGMPAFAETGPHSIARILRDIHSAPLMIGNRRLMENNAQLLLTLRGDS